MKIAMPLIHLDNLVFTPLPQMILKANLLDKGICAAEEVQILEYSRESGIANSLLDILSCEPDIVAFSCYVWNFLVVERLSKAVKEMLGNKCLIVWGGPHVSEIPQMFAEKYPASVDLVVSWYGEHSFVEIVEKHKNGMGADDISAETEGVWAPGVVPPEKKSKFIPLSALPSPHEYGYLPQTVTDHIGDRVFLVETYRNCPFKCGYCLWGQAENKINGLDADQVIATFDKLIGYGARHFKFADAGLGLRKGRDKKIFRSFIDNEIWRENVHLRMYYFWQCLDEEWCEIFEILIGNGVLGQIDIGIQTFNKDAIDLMLRPTNFDKFDQVMGLLKKWELPYSIDLVLGLPGDNYDGWKESVRKTIDYNPSRFQNFMCSILPGSYYDLKRDEFGIKTVRGSLMDDDEQVVETASYSNEDIQKSLDLESWLFLVYTLSLCPNAVKRHASDLGEHPLVTVENMSDWAKANKRKVHNVTAQYRENLYDSRQKGRLLIERGLMDHFVEVRDDLHGYFAAVGAADVIHDALDHDLLRFPKTRQVIDDLAAAGVIAKGSGSFNFAMRDGNIWKFTAPPSEPIIGVIGTKHRYWTWEGEQVTAAPVQNEPVLV